MRSVNRISFMIICISILINLTNSISINKLLGFDEDKVNSTSDVSTKRGIPEFISTPQNITVNVGREAIINCQVKNAGLYKVSFQNETDRLTLSVGGLTLNPIKRFEMHNYDTKHNMEFHIFDVRLQDEGSYYCVVYSDPPISQKSYVKVVDVPIQAYEGNLKVMTFKEDYLESKSVKIKCPVINVKNEVFWRREDNEEIDIGFGNRDRVREIKGPILQIESVTRRQSGIYICIEYDGETYKVVDAVKLQVTFEPRISAQYDEDLGYKSVSVGEDGHLFCKSEGWPKAVVTWKKGYGKLSEPIRPGGKFEIKEIPSSTENDTDFSKFVKNGEPDITSVYTEFTIKNLTLEEIKSPYTCFTKNSLGSDYASVRFQLGDKENGADDVENDVLTTK